ncbi:MAG TPA: hypothetical protein VH370_16115 [Humisphaera sp.]|jgi:hypothetical protein|nr:hypothetical protein [Humisphaera sp.]
MNDAADDERPIEPSTAPSALIDPRHWSAARDALLIQGLLLFFGAIVLDGGYIFKCFGAAAIAFWLGVAIIVIRRPNPAHASDISFVRFGYLALLPIALAAAVLMHRFGH